MTGHIFADESLFDTDRGGPLTHNGADTPDYGGEMSALVYDHGMSARRMSPAVFAAHELALTMRLTGMRVRASPQTRRTPTTAVQLARVESPRLSVLLRLMDVPSDDLIADMLVKQMGAVLFGAGTLDAGAIEVSQSIASSYGLKPVIHDGSGLDRADRSSPADVVSLLRQIWQTPTGNLLHASLPMVGEQGTVKDIGLHSPARGRCVAKTGTLDNVTNLAGYCDTKSGTKLAFALMIDGPSNYAAIPALSRVVASDCALLSSGLRPRCLRPGSPCDRGFRGSDNRAMPATISLNRTELRRYLERIGDRWRLGERLSGRLPR